MIIKFISKSGNILEEWKVPNHRRLAISTFIKNLHEIDTVPHKDTCLVTLDSLSWTFDKKFFEYIWQFCYHTFDLQSKINELKTKLQEATKK